MPAGGVTQTVAVNMLSAMTGTMAGGIAGSNDTDAALFLQQLVFAKLQSAYVITETITITDNSVSLVTVDDPSADLVTVVPGEFWSDAAAGGVLQIGVSGLFYINTAENLANGTRPQVGTQIPVANIEGKGALSSMLTVASVLPY